MKLSRQGFDYRCKLSLQKLLNVSSVLKTCVSPLQDEVSTRRSVHRMNWTWIECRFTKCPSIYTTLTEVLIVVYVPFFKVIFSPIQFSYTTPIADFCNEKIVLSYKTLELYITQKIQKKEHLFIQYKLQFFNQIWRKQRCYQLKFKQFQWKDKFHQKYVLWHNN